MADKCFLIAADIGCAPQRLSTAVLTAKHSLAPRVRHASCRIHRNRKSGLAKRPNCAGCRCGFRDWNGVLCTLKNAVMEGPFFHRSTRSVSKKNNRNLARKFGGRVSGCVYPPMIQRFRQGEPFIPLDLSAQRSQSMSLFSSS